MKRAVPPTTKNLLSMSALILSAMCSTAMAQSGPAGPAGYSKEQLDAMSFHVQNRGDAQIAINTITDDGQDCGAHVTLNPGKIMAIFMCIADKEGPSRHQTQVRMHDGRDYKLFPILRRHIYEIYWDEDKWNLRDVTADRLN
jgi:hypothetical protein